MFRLHCPCQEQQELGASYRVALAYCVEHRLEELAVVEPFYVQLVSCEVMVRKNVVDAFVLAELCQCPSSPVAVEVPDLVLVILFRCVHIPVFRNLATKLIILPEFPHGEIIAYSLVSPVLAERPLLLSRRYCQRSPPDRNEAGLSEGPPPDSSTCFVWWILWACFSPGFRIVPGL